MHMTRNELIRKIDEYVQEIAKGWHKMDLDAEDLPDIILGFMEKTFGKKITN